MGIPRGAPLDQAQLQLAQAVQDRLSPVPAFGLQVFDTPGQLARAILVLRVSPVDHPPCMVDEKVYVRVSSSARPAGPDEIRRLVLGSLAPAASQPTVATL